MRALLVNPNQRTVEAVNADPSNFKSIGELLRCSTLDGCKFRISSKFYWCWVDDTGLVTGKTVFRLPYLYGGLLAGRALIFGMTFPDGLSAPCELDAAAFSQHVMWDDPPRSNQSLPN